MGEAVKTRYLYLVCKQGGEGPCKVGITYKPVSRLATLQTANPHKLAFFEIWDFDDPLMAVEAENLAHAALADCRMIGEWFDIDPEWALSKITLWMAWAAGAAEIGKMPEMPKYGVGMIGRELSR